ncbi:hypothetical protein BDN72DRAFT_589682 [Pluteus cervinus]|uniref:Uncharacterized protein n=1 Tax=Pluteus cervinus TaxID=181527 RepID=A0ACD3AVV9_9AGAR|nr:hypothetical protein BDN72DRAFT_589682 [Pluteus cervinus]
MSTTGQTHGPFNTHDSATARQKINDEIAQLEARIRTLKTTLNTLVPISHLHHEIIQQIFVLSSLPSRGDRIPQIGKACLLLTWVCSSWRELAHETSELWSHIDFINPIWVEAALSRTQSRQLHFQFTFPLEYEGEFDDLALQCLGNLSRITTLSIRDWSDGPSNFPRMSPLWGVPALHLVELSLGGISLPSNLFVGTFPTLRNLSLRNCEFHWDALPVRVGLQKLSLSYPKSQISAEDLIPKLQIIAPELEELSLNLTILPNIIPQPLNSSLQTRFHLKKLRKFFIYEMEASSITFILNHLSLPAHVPRISVKVQSNDVGTSDVHDQFDMARAIVSSRGLAAWPVMTVDVDPEADVLIIVLKEGLIDMDGTATTLNPTSTIHLTFKIFHRSVSEIMPIFSILPLAPIRSLTFPGGHYYNYGLSLMDHFNSSERQGAVRTMNVATFFLNTFTHTINDQNTRLRDNFEIDRVNEEQKTQCRDILGFHHLESLTYEGDGLNDNAQFTWVYYTILSEWLMWRRNVGLKLKRLVFTEMNIPTKEVLRVLFRSDEGVVDILEFGDVNEVTDLDDFAFPFPFDL